MGVIVGFDVYILLKERRERKTIAPGIFEKEKTMGVTCCAASRDWSVARAARLATLRCYAIPGTRAGSGSRRLREDRSASIHRVADFSDEFPLGADANLVEYLPHVAFHGVD
jgi:hypothetical protein